MGARAHRHTVVCTATAARAVGGARRRLSRGRFRRATRGWSRLCRRLHVMCTALPRASSRIASPTRRIITHAHNLLHLDDGSQRRRPQRDALAYRAVELHAVASSLGVEGDGDAAPAIELRPA